MVPLAGILARTGWSPRRSSILALTFVFAACTAEDERFGPTGSGDSTSGGSKAGAGARSEPEAPAGAGGRATEQEGEAGAGSGGVAGQGDSPSRAGSGNDGEAGAGGSDTDPPDPGSENPDPPDYISGLPCEVEALLRARCQNCHSSDPVAGGGISLLTYADLIAPSKGSPKVTMAARSLARMKDSQFPMPPAPASPPTNEEIAAFEAWIEASTPPVNCNFGGPKDPGPDQYLCTTDSYWTGGSSGSPWMMPGHACVACHKTTNSAPRFAVAGTLYATAHEPDTCYGVPASAGAMVVITDANGVELPPIPVSAGGNFFARWTSLAVPYRAKVVLGDSERVMLTPQTNGDCNACHTRDGAQGALGRITLPESPTP
jgi:mono/diheme cytochrome c family protein